MPLRCLQEHTPLVTFDVDVEGWEQLKASHRDNHELILPCCQGSAVPTTSKDGTRYFAHRVKGDCPMASEKPEHLRIRTLICQAARAAGWTVEPEVQGTTAQGEAWSADVLASKGRAKVAIVVLWSRQDMEETQRRQRIFAESGVRALWLMRYPDLLVERDTPTFLLHLQPSTGEATVRLPSRRYEPEWVTHWNKNDPSFWQQSVSLTRFVGAALGGALRFAPTIGQSLPVSVRATKTHCWRCHAPTNRVQELVVLASMRFEGHPDIHIRLAELDGFALPEQGFDTLFPPALLSAHGIGEVKRRYRRATQETYLANGCVACDVIQPSHFDAGDFKDAEPICSYEITLTQALVDRLAEAGNRTITRWWVGAE